MSDESYPDFLFRCNEDFRKEIKKLREQVKDYEAALKFYKSSSTYHNLLPGTQDTTTWIEHDMGHKAREALKRWEKK